MMAFPRPRRIHSMRSALEREEYGALLSREAMVIMMWWMAMDMERGEA